MITTTTSTVTDIELDDLYFLGKYRLKDSQHNR